MSPRILDFNDGFTSSSAPTSTSIAASTISFNPYQHVSSTNVQAALEEIIREKMTEVVSTDNAIVRFDGTTGDVQNSGVIVDDSDGLHLPGKIFFEKQDAASAATITQLTSTKSFVRITGSIVTSVLGVAAGEDGQTVTIHNASSAIVTFKHEDAGAAANDRMKFVDGADIDVDPDSSIELIYDFDQLRWVIKSGAGTTKLVGYQELPVAGVVNGSNVNFQITQEPVTEDSIIVFVDGIALENSEWSITGTTITLSVAPAYGQKVYFFYLSKGTPNPAPPAPSGTYQVEYPTLSGGDVAAKQITLSYLPNTPSKVTLDVIGGSAQIYGDDYLVSGSVLTWSGLGLDDGSLIAGDRLRVVYYS